MEDDMRRRLGDRARQDGMFRGAARNFGIGFVIWFALCVLLSLGVLGLVAWAIIELVTWVTAQ